MLPWRFSVLSVLVMLSACGLRSPSGAELFSHIRADLSEKISVRLVQGDMSSGSIESVLAVVNSQKGTHFTPSMFKLTDERDLFSSLYRRYALVIDSVPVANSSIRVWLNKQTQTPIQVEVLLQSIPSTALFQEPLSSLSEASVLARRRIREERPNDAVRRIQSGHLWVNGLLVRRVTVVGNRGKTEFDFDNASPSLLRTQFRPFERSDFSQTTSFRAPLYKVWEWATDGNEKLEPEDLQSREWLRVENILKEIPRADDDLVSRAEKTNYLLTQEKSGDLSAEDIASGYWNNDFLRTIFPLRFSNPALREQNHFASNKGVRLYGKNAIVMLHPLAPKLLGEGASFDRSPGFDRAPAFDFVLNEAFDGIRVMAPWWNKGAKLPFEFMFRKALDSKGSPRMNDARWLLQNGFDELQVYYAMDRFLEAMRFLGFQDPELSTRPFTAFLFNPDIEYKDNAYYDSDTINFSTYSKGSVNMARDNTTIWHELGHGVMDRVMGPHINAIEGYGLWEGIADLWAEIILTHEVGTKSFRKRDAMRIVNNMWLYNANESHDDGESYGGAMFDLLKRMMNRFGAKDGLRRTSDLVLETMRLTRDHEEMTPVEWFEHMKYADVIDSPSSVANRRPGEALSEINAALEGRNYALGSIPAKFLLAGKSGEITEDSEGSRNHAVDGIVGQASSHEILIGAENGSVRAFTFPVRVEVSYRGGPLQGAIHWIGEDDGVKSFLLQKSGEKVVIPIATDGVCDASNTADGGCKDFVYVKLFNSNDRSGKPIGKKRFYIELKNH